MTDDEALWYKDAIIYELHVRAFKDSDGDGVGDFPGLTEKLDYLQDLGVNAIWLLPFYPSPMRDDGYDISDYTNVHPSYGTLRDFRDFLKETHGRGMRVITELVLNHTSDQHPWFQRARRSPPGSRWREFYVWSDTPEKYKQARVIFHDFETSNWAWDPVAKAYYWHRFYSHQPDLNYDNPHVRDAILDVVDFWLGLGVDGLRLDAVPYLYEREGTSCENLPETHAFLREVRKRVEARFSGRMLLSEANQWPEDAVAYFGQGDECHMAFHFPLMPRKFMAIRMEDRFPIIEVLQQTPKIPETCQWALFLRNHDELTLEMVTDEERDYMYRVYAHDPQMRVNLGIRRRLAPLLRNNRRQIELMNSLLFSLPGTPVIYYGDEIGMGDNIYLGDRNGVRSPMQWSADRNAGFSRANPQKLFLPVIIDPENHYEAVNVEVQQNNPHSLLWWMKRLISLTKRTKVFGRGTLEFLYPENRKVLAFIRKYHDECMLVVANLSRFAQSVELDLSAFKGVEPEEMFGKSRFPAITERPYLLTLGPQGYYFFSLTPRPAEAGSPAAEPPLMKVQASWENALQGRGKAALEALLPGFLKGCRWFSGKGRTVQSVGIWEAIPLPQDSPEASLLLVQVEYTEGDPENYVLPLAFSSGEAAANLQGTAPQAVVCRLEVDGTTNGILHDALWDPDFAILLLETIGRRRRLKGEAGEMVAAPTRAFRSVLNAPGGRMEPSILGTEQSNTSIVYKDKCILKLFRRLEVGVNPELEIGRFLTEEGTFEHTPKVLGSIEYQQRNSQPMTVAVLHAFVPNLGDAWSYTLDAVGRYFERILARRVDLASVPMPEKPLLDLIEGDAPPPVGELIGTYLEAARLLGQRTAELHLALARETDNQGFVPEEFNEFYQRGRYHALVGLLDQTFQLLRRRLPRLQEDVGRVATQVLALEGDIRKRFEFMRERRLTALRIRCHGDYHLGQVLYTGKDFVIIDFEGEPARPLGERRLKRSPFRDVCGMVRSFHYAAHSVLFGPTAVVRPEDVAILEPWARFWYVWVSAAFLKAYVSTAAQGAFLPRQREELKGLLDTFLLEKAIYELGYELNNRPSWVRVPLQGILHLLHDSER